MKQLLTLITLLACLTLHAAGSEKPTAKVKHHVEFEFGNYVSQSVVHSTYSGWGSHLFTPPGQLAFGSGLWTDVYNKPSFLPM